MKTAVLHKPGSPLVIEEREAPRPAAGEILLKVKACGVCHTDLHIVDGEWCAQKLPLIPGHEVVGEVVAVDESVTDFRIGDRAGIGWIYHTCGHCEFCASDRERYCSEYVATGYMVDGGFAEYIKVPATHAVALPQALTFAEAAPLYCAGLTAYRAVKISGLRVGETVAVWGTGGLGQCAVQVAKALGAKVIAIDIAPEKLEVARRLGADVILNAVREKAEEEISASGGAHVALCFAPTEQVIAQAFESLRLCGTLVLVGLPPGNFTLPILGCVRKGVRILTCAVGTRQDLREVLALAAAGKVKCLVETCRVDQINEVFERMRRGRIAGRVVVEFP
ncbi:MAG: zinc-dependent alcohol dehydrogenase [Acidobacteria bacterium]|nr:zinc-dependent alcohol dehydrogenase [Acidobacteriota bacterium]